MTRFDRRFNSVERFCEYSQLRERNPTNSVCCGARDDSQGCGREKRPVKTSRTNYCVYKMYPCVCVCGWVIQKIELDRHIITPYMRDDQTCFDKNPPNENIFFRERSIWKKRENMCFFFGDRLGKQTSKKKLHAFYTLFRRSLRNYEISIISRCLIINIFFIVSR